MTNKEFAVALEKRTQKFAASVVLLSQKLPHTPEGRKIKEQLTDAGTSIGGFRQAQPGAIIEKPIVQGVVPISEIKCTSAKANVPKHNIGSK